MPMFRDPAFCRLKAAQRDLITRCGGIERAGEIAGACKSQAGRWTNAADPTLMPLAAVLALEVDCGAPLVTAALAAASQCRLVAAETDAPAASPQGAHADLMLCHAQLLGEAAQAFADGRLTPGEASVLDRICGPLAEALEMFRGALAQVKAGG